MSVFADRPLVDEAMLADIVRRVLNVTDADRIIVFGSAATGAMTEDSDIDLLVVKQRVEDKRRESDEIRAALGYRGYPLDVFVMTVERFEETKNVIGGLAFPANKYGKVIYEKSNSNCG